MENDHKTQALGPFDRRRFLKAATASIGGLAVGACGGEGSETAASRDLAARASTPGTAESVAPTVAASPPAVEAEQSQALPLPGLTVAFSSTEGYATTNGLVNGPAPRIDYAGGGQMYYESAYVTKDGTLIEAFTGEHGTFNNRVGEWNPNTGAMTEVFPNNFAANGVNGYDNLNYCYFDEIDSLVVFPRGAYDRTISDVSGSAWKYIYPGNSTPPVGRAPLHSSNSASNALIYVPSASLASYEVAVSYFNAHVAYGKQFDCAVILGGGQGGSPPSGFYMMTVIVPSHIISSSTVPRYTAIHRQLSAAESQAGGVQAILSEGRAGIKFVGKYVYWCGGLADSNTVVPYLFRSDITRLLNSTDPMNEPFVAEKMADAPVAFSRGALSHDPYSNTLTLLNQFGVYLYDIATDSWQTITNQCAEYVSAFESVPFISYPHADFVDYAGTTKHRKTFFMGGWNGVDPWGDANRVNRYQKVRSIRVTRTGEVSYLNVTAANPESPATDWTNLFANIKHQGLIVTGTGSSRTLTLISGDFSGYPNNTNTTSGYKAEGVYDQSGRQDIWRAAIGDAQLASGARFSLVSNAYAAYPWNGTAGVNAGATRPIAGADALGAVVDKRGQWWLGPTTHADYVDTHPEIMGQKPSYSAMFQWTLPGVNATGFGVPGVALGNGWTLPPQDMLYDPVHGGTLGVDYTVGGGADAYGWGRPHARSSVYDATNDRIYTIQLTLDGSGKRIGVNLLAFNPNPTDAASAGKYAWSSSGIQYKTLKQFGGPSDSQYSGMTAWGNAGDGTINTSAQLIGRRLYFVAVWQYNSPSNGLEANTVSGVHRRAHLYSISVDTPSDIEWIPFPQSQNWWLRGWDGPDSLAGSNTTTYPPYGGSPLTPAQYRSLAGVGTKLVLGPDAFTKIGVDPWIQVYDTIAKTWTSFQAPSDHDWPNTLFAFLAVPDLGEVWLAGSLPGEWATEQFRIDYGMHQPTANSGRRIVRFKVT